MTFQAASSLRYVCTYINIVIGVSEVSLLLVNLMNRPTIQPSDQGVERDDVLLHVLLAKLIVHQIQLKAGHATMCEGS